MTHSFHHLLSRFIVTLIAVFATACSSDSPGNGEPTEPDFPEPEETVTVSLYKNTGQNLDGISVTASDRFTSSNGCLFAHVGPVKGLGAITGIPKHGWADSAPIRKGDGYVAYNPSYPHTFYRIFVSNSAADEMGTITGFQLKYQKPFYGADEAVTLDRTEFTVPAEGGEYTLMATDSSVIPFIADTDADWITLDAVEYIVDPAKEMVCYLHFKVAAGNSLEAAAAHITIKSFSGRQTTVDVSRAALAPWQATTSILDLKKKYFSNGPMSCHRFTEPEIIRGRVVSSDECGNIYKTLVIEDGTAAIPVLINAVNLYRTFPFGQEVAVNLLGLCIGNYMGYLQIGEPSSDGYISFMPTELFAPSRQYQLIGNPAETVVPTPTDLSVLVNALPVPSELARWQARYVTVSGISFTEQNVPLSESHGTTTNHTIYDKDNHRIVVRTSGYATFRATLTPKGVGSLSGVLSYYNGRWQLMLNSIDGIGPFDPDATIELPNPEPIPDPDHPAGAGTEANPYNAAAVIVLNSPGTESWVEAYIVGSADGASIDQGALMPPFQSATNILLADNPDETDLTKCVPVQLIANTPARINLNLRDHPDLLGRRVRVLGTLARYFNRPGVKSTSSFGL